MMLEERSTYLYKHWNYDGVVIYVGITANPEQRLYNHKRNASWFKEVSQVSFKKFSNRLMARTAERYSIKTDKPAYNLRDKNGFHDGSVIKGDTLYMMLAFSIKTMSSICGVTPFYIMDILKGHLWDHNETQKIKKYITKRQY